MRYAFIPALILLAAGCAGEPEVYAIVQDRAYTPSEFRFASQHKDFPTVFSGDLFDRPRREVRDAILAAMQPGNWWFSEAFTPRTRFTDAPAGASPYRVTVSLNPEQDVGPDRYCTPRDTTPAAGPSGTGEIEVRMAFCVGETLLSTSHGALEDVASPSDPRFRRMITQMTMALFPQRRDDDRDCGPAGMRRSC